MQRVITEAQKSKFLVAIDRGVIACVCTLSLSHWQFNADCERHVYLWGEKEAFHCHIIRNYYYLHKSLCLCVFEEEHQNVITTLFIRFNDDDDAKVEHRQDYCQLNI